ncbi:MAG: RICIN domain-containing protein [Proteobacteria bacterium]|nr:RICIN domain-containing protein [Pseudomonadota bacterium]
MKLGTLIYLAFLLVAIACHARDPLVDKDKTKNLSGNAQPSTIDELDELIESYKAQLQNNKNLSDTERDALQEKLDDALDQRDSLQKSKSGGDGKPIVKSPIPSEPITEGPYAVYYGTDCLQPVDIAKFSDGSIYRASPCKNLPAQYFNLESRSDAYMRLVHKDSKKCMRITGAVTVEGENPSIQPCKVDSDAAEQWRYFDKSPDGSKFKLQNKLSNFCLKIATDGIIFQGDCGKNYTEFMLRKSG